MSGRFLLGALTLALISGLAHPVPGPELFDDLESALTAFRDTSTDATPKSQLRSANRALRALGKARDDFGKNLKILKKVATAVEERFPAEGEAAQAGKKTVSEAKIALAGIYSANESLYAEYDSKSPIKLLSKSRRLLDAASDHLDSAETGTAKSRVAHLIRAYKRVAVVTKLLAKLP